MTHKTTLSMALILTASLHVNADELKEITISSTSEKSVFTSAEYINTQEFRNTLPSNMISTANSSGIKIDGATSDFTSVYWNGIKVTDPSNTNAYPTFMNYGRNASEKLSVDGSNINYTSTNDNYAEVQAGEKSYMRANVSTSFTLADSTHTLKLEGLSQNTRTSFSDERSVTSNEEKDKESNYNLAYLSSVNFAKNYNAKIALMHKKVEFDYDSAPKDAANFDYSTDPNDPDARYDTTANVGGIDIGYLKGSNELKADVQYTSTDSEHFGSYPSEYDSQLLRYGFKASSNLGLNNIKLKASAYGVKESGKLASTFNNMDKTREYVDYALAFIYNYDKVIFNLAYDSSYKDTTSFNSSLKFPLSAGFSLLAKYEDKGVNPTIFQESNPFGAANDDLSSQKLNRVSAGFMYERKNVMFKVDYSQIKTEDMIVWVTIDPATFVGQYQNVENTQYNFLRATLDYQFLDGLALNLDYSNISNLTSSTPSLVYNLPEHKAIAKLDYFSSMFNAYFLTSYTSDQNSFSGAVDATTTYNMGIGYNVLNDLEIRADVYNLTDEYYEVVASYPEAGRIITAGLKYQF